MTAQVTNNQPEGVGRFSLSHVVANLGRLTEYLVDMCESLKGLKDEAVMALALLDVGETMSNASNYGEEVAAVKSLEGLGDSNPAFAPASDYLNAAYADLDNGKESKSKNQSKDYSLAHTLGEESENTGKMIINSLKSLQSGLMAIFKDLTQVAKNMQSNLSAN